MSTRSAQLDAIQAAIVTVSGFNTARVLWKFQNADAPALDYCALSLGVATEVGQDFIVEDYSALRSPGSEFRETVTGTREISLQCEVFSAATVSSVSAADAMETAENIRTGLRLTAVRAALATVGVVPFDRPSVTYIPDVVSVGFRGRALVTVRCYMPAPAVVAYTGYIATVEGTITVSGGHPDPTVIDYTAP